MKLHDVLSNENVIKLNCLFGGILDTQYTQQQILIRLFFLFLLMCAVFDLKGTRTKSKT